MPSGPSPSALSSQCPCHAAFLGFSAERSLPPCDHSSCYFLSLSPSFLTLSYSDLPFRSLLSYPLLGDASQPRHTHEPPACPTPFFGVSTYLCGHVSVCPCHWTRHCLKTASAHCRSCSTPHGQDHPECSTGSTTRGCITPKRTPGAIAVHPHRGSGPGKLKPQHGGGPEHGIQVLSGTSAPGGVH